MTIRSKLILVLLGCIIIPTTIGIMAMFSVMGNVVKDVRIIQLENIVDLQRARIDAFFLERQDDIKLFQTNLNVQKNLPIFLKYTGKKQNQGYLDAKKELEKLLAAVRLSYGYLDVMLTDTNGKIVLAANQTHISNEIGIHLSDIEPDAFEGGRHQTYFSGIYRSGNGFGMLCTAPLFSDSKDFLGELVFEIDAGHIFDFVHTTTGLGDTGETFIGIPHGDEVMFISPLHPDRNELIPLKVLAKRNVALPMQSMLRDNRDGFGESVDYLGHQVLAAWRRIPSVGWGIVAKIDYHEALAPVAKLKKISLLAELIILVFYIAALFFFSQSIITPIHTLQKGMEIVGSGRLDYKVGMTVNDEIGQLSRAFDRMSENLQMVTASRDDLDKEVRERKQAEANINKLNRIYAVLSSGNHLILRSSSQEMLFKEACRILVEEGLFKMAWVGLAEERTKSVQPVACWGCSDGYLDHIKISLDAVPESEGPTGQAIRTGRTFVNNDTENNPIMQPWRDEALKHHYLSSAAFPLIFNSKPIGALMVYSNEKFFFDDKEIQLLEAFAQDISYAVKSMEQEELRRMAETGRRQAEVEARELGDKLQSLVEDAFVGVYILQSRQFVYVNHRLAEMIGYQLKELLALEDFSRLIHPDDQALVEENIRKRLEGEASQMQYEFRMHKKNGDVIFVEVLSSYTFYSGKPSIIGSIIDITARKQLEQQKADLYAMITHDFKSPLTVIIGCSGYILTLKNQGLDPDVQGMIADIQYSSVNLLNMIDDFLAFSMIESSGLLSLNLVSTDILEIVKRVTKDLGPAVAGKKLSLIEKFSDHLPLVMSDQMLLRRSIANLLQNAINFTPSGGQVTLTTERVVIQEASYVVISVADTGPGIAAGEHEKIFEKYYRSPRDRETKGSGLGLAIVKTVTEAHGGKVELESEEGKGAIFKVFIPSGDDTQIV
ncbi:MAG: hypothetical protein A2381_19490 [Bdellovibrionales bacterium RIFOXYB1_FULL_37_110]|nr:MAG: hypothetical protein A2417_10990 [Bdellovibrionales bacterium RIFOXYC1_FULL_37_79]OFZ60664.1 MAG: hypothetical protein A2381_19490 [Bdellovibrionales bacterium RIFOXYB1_FULL_37_110]OFZ64416.1 MAG: hypothetical protein A2577_10140 [Bdellovibrionales bacterium RIFOXYD1_FULL_36_51]